MIAGNNGVAILIYGPSGIGKSTDVGHVFRKAAWLQTEPGGLIPVIRCVGYTPQYVQTLFDDVNPTDELTRAIDAVLNQATSGRFSSIVLDTGSEVAERMIGELQRKSRDGRQAYGALLTKFSAAIQKIIVRGLWFICICHELPPETDPTTGNKLRGGPLFPGKKLPRAMPPKFDLVLHADIKHSVGTAERIYNCNPLDPDYIAKDRFGVTQNEQPMELAPIVYRIMYPGKPVPKGLLKKQLNVRGN